MSTRTILELDPLNAEIEENEAKLRQLAQLYCEGGEFHEPYVSIAAITIFRACHTLATMNLNRCNGIHVAHGQYRWEESDEAHANVMDAQSMQTIMMAFIVVFGHECPFKLEHQTDPRGVPLIVYGRCPRSGQEVEVARFGRFR